MTTIKKIQNEDGTWLFLVPISGLLLTKSVNFEFKVDRVSFIAASHLPFRRKQYGFPSKISELRNRHKGLLNRFFSSEKVFATLRLQGKGKQLKETFLKLVREELAILSLFQLGYSRRRHNAFPAMSMEYKPSKLSYLLLNTNSASWIQQNTTKGKIGELALDASWKSFHNNFFFFDLIKIISKQTNIAKSWRKDIRNAAILAGQSQCSSDIPLCFIWNMIAIELLLTQQGDFYNSALPERAEAFIGWSINWKRLNYRDRISDAYRKRCGFIHAGNREAITIKDVLFTDDIILNLLVNIVKNTDIFYSKKQLIDFSEKVKAEHLLGIKSKVRPQSLQFVNLQYIRDDYDKI